MKNLKAPFPYFGGKSRVAEEVWRRFGTVKNYVEPFFGSGAVLLRRPFPFEGTETVNDKDGMVSNFWRAVKADPDLVAEFANWPVNQNDLTARHYWLVDNTESIVGMLEADPEWYDAKAAGWWAWAVSQWIGSGFCAGKGPWKPVDGKMVKTIKEKGRGINRQMPNAQACMSKGVHALSVSIDRSDEGEGLNIYRWFQDLSDRLRRVRVCCGDWTKVCGNSVINVRTGHSAIFLDPPYSTEANRADVYLVEDFDIANKVREWCIEKGKDPKLRTALCGYEGEHNDLEAHGWSVWEWKAVGGYGLNSGSRGRDNRSKERIWFSPACLP
jgi:site-specific DNA-adenine methylase